jgi:hypothetical protein
MMNANNISIDQLDALEIRDWLQSALEGKQALPYSMPGESHHLAIMRLQQAQRSDTRNLLVSACIALLREFCAGHSGDSAYVDELIFLAALQKNDECISLLARRAKTFNQAPQLSLSVRHSILAVLADASPPQTMAFWEEILKQDRNNYAGMVLAGALASDPMQALRLLPEMPDEAENGEFGALNLDLTWDALPKKLRGPFVDEVAKMLAQCGRNFAAPIQEWLATKDTNLKAAKASVKKLLLAVMTTKPHDYAAKRTVPTMPAYSTASAS